MASEYSHRRQPERGWRSEEHTSELQSPQNLVCRLLLEKKKQQTPEHTPRPQTTVRLLDGSTTHCAPRSSSSNRRTPCAHTNSARRLSVLFFFLMIRRPPRSTLFPYTALFCL